jgi:hypothetical protein
MSILRHKKTLENNGINIWTDVWINVETGETFYRDAEIAQKIQELLKGIA